MTPRNHTHVIGRLALALGIPISAGALLGAVLRLVSIGYFLFWLVVGLHAILASITVGVIFTARRDRSSGPYRGGNLNEYVFLSLIFDSGLIPGLWLTLPWQPANVAVIGVAGLALALALLVYVLS